MSAKSFAAPPSVRRPPHILQTVTIKVVEVLLRAGEKYAYSQMYADPGQKREISSKKVSQGRRTLWDHVRFSYRFTDDLSLETDCVEIVVIKNPNNPSIEQVWSIGKGRNTIPSYFDSMQWTDDSDTVCIQEGDVIEIRLKPQYPYTPSPERAGGNGRAASRQRTPAPPKHKVCPPDNPSLFNLGPAQTHFVAMRACLLRIE
jgi:hypothetical protein